MTRRHPRICLLGVWMKTHNFQWFYSQKNKKGGVVRHFQQNWQNYKIAISPAGKIESTPNFDRVIEPHSWLRGWSRAARQNSNSSWRTAAILQNVGNAITRLPMDRFGWNLGVRISSYPWYVRHDAVAMATAVARPLLSNGAEHSAVMGVWRPNAWTNFDELWYTTANLDHNNSHVIEY